MGWLTSPRQIERRRQTDGLGWGQLGGKRPRSRQRLQIRGKVHLGGPDPRRRRGTAQPQNLARLGVSRRIPLTVNCAETAHLDPRQRTRLVGLVRCRMLTRGHHRLARANPLVDQNSRNAPSPMGPHQAWCSCERSRLLSSAAIMMTTYVDMACHRPDWPDGPESHHSGASRRQRRTNGLRGSTSRCPGGSSRSGQ